jgi:hypothetical protein
MAKKVTEEKALVKFGDFQLAQIQADEITALFAANMDGETITQSDLERIKVPAGGGLQWEVTDPDSGEPENAKELTGIIVYMKNCRAFWASRGTNSPPDCKSDDGKTGIGTPGGDCLKCKQAQFGTATNQAGQPGKGQACKAMKMIFLLQRDGIIPRLVIAPPTSLKPIKKFRLDMIQTKRFINHSIVSLGLENDKAAGGEKYSKMTIRYAGDLTDAEAAIVDAYAATMKAGWAQVGVESGDYSGEQEPTFDPEDMKG